MAFRGDLEALILAVLLEGPKHGYEISKQIKAMSGKTLQFGEGQLYPSLHKLEEAGSVQSTWEPQDGKPPRKIYALTESGKSQLDKKKIEWSKFQESVTLILGIGPLEEPSRG